MERLREFIQNRRNSAIVLLGLVAVAVIGCCVIGIYAISGDLPVPVADELRREGWFCDGSLEGA